MIHIGTPASGMDPRFAVAPGGFAWWYLDVVTPEGDGLVLIWSYGLPFLPGYAGAARAGRAERPSDRPSLNVVVYRGGRPVVYLLQEYGPGDAEAVAGFEPGADPAAGETDAGLHLRLGGSRFASRVEGGRRRVEVEIDCAMPGTRERLRGTVRVDGVARRAEGGETDPPDEPHVWTPLTGPAHGEVALRCGDRAVARFAGRAYHDRNGGSVPLHGLGMDFWMWGRLPFRDREAIYYLLWPHGSEHPERCIGVEIDQGGKTRRIPGLRLERAEPRRTLAGLPWSARLRLLQGRDPWLEVRHTRVIDSGPFYLRFLSEATSADGERATGMGELCYPERVDQALLRPLVRMKVHRVHGGNSMWLPLFTGPHRGRVIRLLRSLLPSRVR
jgi:carotenoid 1,2-hydratase